MVHLLKVMMFLVSVPVLSLNTYCTCNERYFNAAKAAGSDGRWTSTHLSEFLVESGRMRTCRHALVAVVKEHLLVVVDPHRMDESNDFNTKEFSEFNGSMEIFTIPSYIFSASLFGVGVCA